MSGNDGEEAFPDEENSFPVRKPELTPTRIGENPNPYPDSLTVVSEKLRIENASAFAKKEERSSNKC